MNYLKDKIVYLCGSIHAVSDDGLGWRTTITPNLTDIFGVIVDDPCKKTVNGQGEVADDKKILKELIKDGKFLEVKEKFYPIVRKDLRSVDKCDFLIVVYDPTVHLVGTIAEIILAHQQRKPMLMFFDKAKQESVNPWIFTYFKDTCIFTEWNKMFEYLENINSGKFDTSYWTL
jgi:hypothetical protein